MKMQTPPRWLIAVLRLAVYYGCTMEELLTKNLRKERKNIT
mgnify:CR=1 FL=1